MLKAQQKFVPGHSHFYTCLFDSELMGCTFDCVTVFSVCSLFLHNQFPVNVGTTLFSITLTQGLYPGTFFNHNFQTKGDTVFLKSDPCALYYSGQRLIHMLLLKVNNILNLCQMA